MEVSRAGISLKPCPNLWSLICHTRLMADFKYMVVYHPLGGLLIGDHCLIWLWLGFRRRLRSMLKMGGFPL